MPLLICRQLTNFLFAGKVLPVLIGWILFSGGLNAQKISIHHPQIQYLFEDSLLQLQTYHSIFKPLEISRNLYNSVMRNGTSSENNALLISPVIDAMLEYQKEGSQFLYRFGQGIYASGALGKKAGFELSATLYEQKFNKQNSYMLDSLGIVPGHNRYLWKSELQTGYVSFRGFVYWKPNRWLTLKAGNDKHFIGDGARSLLLSENAAAYPFLQTRLHVWKINYTHQLLFMRDVLPDSAKTRYSKYASMHTLSFNATRKLNFYVFEAVIWRAQDSARYRSFDATYLNPFLFFRPVEFNMGSPDNVLLGIGGKWFTGAKTFIYGQLMLDEFRIKEVKANSGWWASKYAYQVGFKTFSLFKNYTSFLLAEYTNCRPFMYSHTNSLQNYGYLYTPLGHPQGSNFREVLTQFGIALDNQWFINASGNYLRYGTDPEGENYGSDLYKKQWTFTKAYGNFTGQGILHEEVHFELTVSRLIKPLWRLRAFTTIQTTFHKTGGKSVFMPAFMVGVNTWMYE